MQWPEASCRPGQTRLMSFPMSLRVSLFQAPSSTLLEPEDVGRLVWVHALASLQQPCSDGACPLFFFSSFPPSQMQDTSDQLPVPPIPGIPERREQPTTPPCVWHLNMTGGDFPRGETSAHSPRAITGLVTFNRNPKPTATRPQFSGHPCHERQLFSLDPVPR